MKTGNAKIKWKLFFYMFTFVFAMLIMLWLFQTVFLADFYKAVKTEQIKSAAAFIEKNIDSEELPEMLSRFLERDNSLSVLLYNENDEIIFTPRPIEPAGFFRAMPPDGPPEEIGQLIASAKSRGRVTVVMPSRRLMDARPAAPFGFADRLLIGRPGTAENIVQVSEAVNKDGVTTYILISALITPVDATVSTLRFQLLLISFILLLFAVALSLIISRKFARPIMEINEVAKQLTVGNYDVTFNTAGYREINELNDTLNNAAFELSRVEGLRRELLANVSHDLRTPLTMITGFAEMMRDLPDENTKENAQVIIDESNRLTNLVADLLDISKLEDKDVKSTVFCLTDVVGRTIGRIAELAALSESRQIIFEAEEAVNVCANETQITQVIYNLIANALNYSEGDVVVKQIINGGKIRVEVHDSGHGISEADLPYVWERYYKASSPHKRANIGTGLGLSIVRGVMERHNGACGASSKEGVGSVFWFELAAVIESHQ